MALNVSQTDTQISTQRYLTNQQKQIQEQKNLIAENKRKLEEARAKLPERQSQQALRGKYAGITGRNVRQQIQGAEKNIARAGEQVSQYEGQVTQYEKQYQEYLKTPEGIMSYASEAGIEPTITYKKVLKGYVPAKFVTYETPYGTYVDDSDARKQMAQNEFEAEGKAISEELIRQSKLPASERTGVNTTQFYGKYGFDVKSAPAFTQQLKWTDESGKVIGTELVPTIGLVPVYAFPS